MAKRQSLFTTVAHATRIDSVAHATRITRFAHATRITKLVPTLALAVSLSLAAAACGGDSSDEVQNVDTTVSAVETTLAAEFPVTVGDLTLEAEPQRVVSMSATATEMLFAVGAGDKVVAVDSFSNFPADIESLPKVDAYQPSVEAISELEPDLVIISYDPGNFVDQLNALAIPVFAAYAVANLDGAYEQMKQLGALTGQAEEAAVVVNTMRSEIDAIVASVTKQDPPLTYFYELDPTLYSVTTNTFIGSVMAQFGLVSIADGVQEVNNYPQLSAEVIVEKNPDLIFLADVKCCAQSAATVAEREGWSVLRAVNNGSIVELDDDVASRWGPRLVDLMKQVAAAIETLKSGS
ncbi:MAG: ABC transporter substrate-binding protein [Ilumatobacteraceae bacterium]